MHPTLRPLRGYEPHSGETSLTWADFTGTLVETDRWTSLRPRMAPQVTVDPPDDGSFRVALTKILEVLDGRRHIGQLQSLLTHPVYEATLTRLRVTPPAGLRYRLQSFHTCRPGLDAIEVCGRVETVRIGPRGRRAQAVVARLERQRGLWRCVFLRIL